MIHTPLISGGIFKDKRIYETWNDLCRVIYYHCISGCRFGGIFLDSRPPLKITIVVDSLAQEWLEEAVTSFNENKVRINNETVLVEIVPFSAGRTTTSNDTSTTASTGNAERARQVNLPVIDDMDVWNNNANLNWTVANHPDIWIPASSLSVEYASSLAFQIVEPSIAWTPMVFGVNQDAYNLLTANNTIPLEWQQIVSASENGEILVAFPLPNDTINGLGVLYSAAAGLSNNSTIDRNFLHGDFQDQFDVVIDSVANFNQTGTNAANYMARFPNSADIGIAPESQWLMALSNLNTIQFSYPAHPFVFDFPVAMWEDDNTTDNERKAVQAFVDWLMTDSQQTLAPNYGLRSVNAPPANSVFTSAQPLGIQPALTMGIPIDAPPLVETRTLLSWFEQIR